MSTTRPRPRASGRDHLAPLGPDLAALVAGVGTPLTRAVPITRLPSDVLRRASFRLDFQGGARLKGRRLDTPAEIERVATLVTGLGLPALTRVVAWRGSAMLEQWIAGAPLETRRQTPEDCRRAGELLGTIHRAPAPDAPGAAGPPSPAWRLVVIDARLAELVSGGFLSTTVADRLRDVARAHMPTDQTVGVTHGDFCAENLVRGAAGALHAVDNETLVRDALDLDLARTWYRWPMTSAQRREFDTAYAAYRPLDTYRAHFLFWAIVVLTAATYFRQHARTRAPLLPLRRLIDLAANPGVAR